VHKWWPCNNHHEHLEIQFDYEKNSLIMKEIFLDKRILEKLTKKGKKLDFLWSPTS